MSDFRGTSSAFLLFPLCATNEKIEQMNGGDNENQNFKPVVINYGKNFKHAEFFF